MARTNVTKRQIRFPISSINRDVLFNKLAEHDAALDAIGGQVAADISEAPITSGVIPVTSQHSDISITGTQAYTIAAGTKVGQMKSLRVTTAASTPAGTLTGTFLNANAAATTIALSAVTHFVLLVWNGAAWVIRYAVSGTIS